MPNGSVISVAILMVFIESGILLERYGLSQQTQLKTEAV